MSWYSAEEGWVIVVKIGHGTFETHKTIWPCIFNVCVFRCGRSVSWCLTATVAQANSQPIPTRVARAIINNMFPLVNIDANQWAELTKKLIWKMKIKQLCVALTGHRTILCALSVYSVSCFSRMTLAMLSSAVLTTALCLFICLTQAGIAPERLNGLGSFLTSRLLAAYTRK